MEMVKVYEVYGCWSNPKHPSTCPTCGEELKLVPKKGHFNSKYWPLERNGDGMKLFCCPTGCRN